MKYTIYSKKVKKKYHKNKEILLKTGKRHKSLLLTKRMSIYYELGFVIYKL
jgi:hypothetical protein